MIGQTRPRIERAMKILRRPQARVGVIPSPLGKLLVAESDRGLAAIHFLFISGGERTLELLRMKFDLIENRTERAPHRRRKSIACSRAVSTRSTVRSI